MVSQKLKISHRGYGRKKEEMFYLTMHSTHLIYAYMASDIWLRTIEKGNPLPPYRLLFLINSKGSFIMHHPTDRIAHTTAFVTPVVEHWLEWEIAQWVHPMQDRSDDPSHHERTLLPRSYISFLPVGMEDILMIFRKWHQKTTVLHPLT